MADYVLIGLVSLLVLAIWRFFVYMKKLDND